ncbi:hypothetical protein E9993_14360 [Labilibacter sediminis]|nr:hypothetical protein E9993_14360 [Labilibacter sediminis]
MKISLKVKENVGIINAELKMNSLQQINDVFLIDIDSFNKDEESLDIYPASFMASASLIFTTENLRSLSVSLDKEKIKDISPFNEVICSLYLDPQGNLTIGTIHFSTDMITLYTEKKLKLIDYGKYLNWCNVTNSTPLSLYAFAKNELFQNNNFTVKKPDYAARSFS